MKLLTVLSFGLFKRNIGSIVASFTKVRTELQIAIDEQQTVIDKAELAKNKADEKSASEIEATNAREAKAIQAIKDKAKAERTKSICDVIAVTENSLDVVVEAKAQIDIANKWIAKIPSID